MRGGGTGCGGKYRTMKRMMPTDFEKGSLMRLHVDPIEWIQCTVQRLTRREEVPAATASVFSHSDPGRKKGDEERKKREREREMRHEWVSATE